MAGRGGLDWAVDWRLAVGSWQVQTVCMYLFTTLNCRRERSWRSMESAGTIETDLRSLKRTVHLQQIQCSQPGWDGERTPDGYVRVQHGASGDVPGGRTHGDQPSATEFHTGAGCSQCGMAAIAGGAKQARTRRGIRTSCSIGGGACHYRPDANGGVTPARSGGAAAGSHPGKLYDNGLQPAFAKLRTSHGGSQRRAEAQMS